MMRDPMGLVWAMGMSLLVAWASAAPGHAAEPELSGLSGVVVQVGAKDGAWAMAAARSAPVVVLVLVEPGQVEPIREAVSAAGLAGQVMVREASGTIPLIDGLASVVVRGDASVAVAEAQRALGPRGRLIEADGSVWVKPVPPTHDDWPQYFHDGAATDRSSDRAVGPVRGVQWQVGTISMRGLTQDNPRVGLRIAGGLVLHATADRLIARDARNGLPVWERSDLSVPDKLRYAFLADAEVGRVWLLPRYTRAERENAEGPRYLQVLDLHTGESLGELDQGVDFATPAGQKVARGQTSRAEDAQVVLAGGLLVMVAKGDLAVVDAVNGDRRWARELEDAEFWTPIVADGVVYVVEGPRVESKSYTHWPMGRVQRIAAYDAATGQPKWSTVPKTDGLPIAAYNITVHRGQLAAACRVDGVNDTRGARLLILDAATGKQQHLLDLNTGKMLGRGHSHIRVMGHGEHWLTNEITTGWMIPQQTAGDPSTWRQPFDSLRPAACQVWRATPDYLIGAATLAEFETQTIHDNSASRTACDIGSFPAEGLLFQGENHCWCKPYIPGLNAMHSHTWPETANGDRLAAGPASPAPASPPQDDAWPQYMHSGWRGNWNRAATLGQAPLTEAWRIEPEVSAAHPGLRREWGDLMVTQGHHVTGVSVAEGIAAYARTPQGEVVALDPATGAERWRIRLDGRIDSQPTIHRGLVIVGTHAGTVHALNRDTGQRVWRYQLAPTDMMISVHGQLASPWPVHGAVTIVPEGVFATAGRHSEMDGGIHWAILDPLTGRPVHRGVYVTDSEAARGPFSGRTGLSMPPATDGKHYFYAKRPYVFRDGQMLDYHSPDHPALKEKVDGQAIRWRVGWLAPVIQPGLSTLMFGLPGGGYHQLIWGGSYARQLVYEPGEADYLNMGGVTRGTWKGRGGDSTDVVARMRRFDELQPEERSGRKEVGAQMKWEVVYDRGIGESYGIRVTAASADRVLIGVTYHGMRDAWKRERENKPMHKLDVVDWQSGDVLQQDIALPAPPVIGGVSIAGGRVFVACEDGSILCFRPGA